MVFIHLHYQQQRGAVEACWAHNPEVDGSKPSAAIIFFYKLMNFSFFVPWRFHHPLIAQLVERRTVVGFAMQTSLGRWFESGSRDSFSY